MSKKYQPLLITHYMSTWVTITEAVEITTKAIKQKITPSDIYRHALSGNILLSVYFQSPVILKKIQTFNGKIKFRQFEGDLLDKLCMLDRDGFIYGQNLRLCTEARYICPVQQIIDTPLLRKLNQFRTFVRNVRPGDELDVQAQVSEKNLTPPPGNSSDNLEQQIASTSQQIGSLLAEDMNSEQAANMARGWASSQASGAMTDWLSRFGTARITLGVDEDFSLKNSQFDFLHPWYETPDNLFFSQHTLHRTDERTQINNGLGWRHFTPTWMSGINFFFDHDLSRYPSRAGIGAENCNANASGAYTGEISTGMLLDAGCKYVILGHSERRAMGETDAEINAKTLAALNAGLTPIVCCGESLEQREAGITEEWITMQIKLALAGVPEEKSRKLVIAYEPIWAIGTGRTATPEQAEEVCEHIRSIVRKLFGSKNARATTILYGGSLNEKNAFELLAQPDIDGGLIGGASLVPEKFVKIIEAANQPIA